MSFNKITEQASLYSNLEQKSVRELLEEINREDQKVAEAVRHTIPQVEELVNQIVPRMEQGGRIFYLGAGTSGRLGVLDASEIPPTFGLPPTSVMIRLGRVKGNQMVNMQLTNQKLVDRGTRMVADELGLSDPQSRRLLLLYGSAAAAIDGYRHLFSHEK